MSDREIRKSIADLMNGVPGIGVVHQYDRRANDDATLKAFYQAEKNGPLHGWEISREGLPTIEKIGGKYKLTHAYAITGYYAVNDKAESEILFNLVLDAVVQKFIDKRIPGVEFHPIPIFPRIYHYALGGVLCHKADGKMSVTEVVEKTALVSMDLLKHHISLYLEPNNTIEPGAVPDETADVQK